MFSKEKVKNLVFIGLTSTLFSYFGWLVWRICSFPGYSLNVDTYYYIAKGSSWVFCNSIKLQDAFTVGIILPSMMGVLGIAFKLFHVENIIFWLILSTKIIVVFSYAIVIACCLYTKNEDKDLFYTRIVLVSTALMTFTLASSISSWEELVRDGISMNGEIVCIALISMQILLLDIVRHSKLKYFSHAIIFVIIFNTKIQAAPISLLIIFFASDKGSRHYYIFWLLGLLACAEIALYEKQVGFLYNHLNLIKYIQKISPDQDIQNLIFIRILNSIQTTTNTIKLFPVILICILLSLSSRYHKRVQFVNTTNFYILLVVVFICVNLPNRTFVHYSMLYWVPFVYFVRNYRIEKINEFFLWIPTILIPVWIILILSYWNDNHFSRSSSFHEALSPYKKNEMQE